MSVYHGPRLRLMRALGMELPGLSKKTIERRPYPPGDHGAKVKRKQSTFGQQLKEKQKLRFNYGVSERQLRRYVKHAFRNKKANPGHLLLETLERRLDSIIFRSGLAPTIPAARQLVSHGHIHIHGKRVDIPSYLVNVGDEIALSAKALSLPVVKSSLEAPSLSRPLWLNFDQDTKRAKIVQLPDRDSFPFPINEKMIVEYYTQRS